MLQASIFLMQRKMSTVQNKSTKHCQKLMFTLLAAKSHGMLNCNACFFLILHCSHLGGIDGYIAYQMFQLVNNGIVEKTSQLPTPNL